MDANPWPRQHDPAQRPSIKIWADPADLDAHARAALEFGFAPLRLLLTSRTDLLQLEDGHVRSQQLALGL